MTHSAAAAGQQASLVAELAAPLLLAGRLFARHWPALLLTATLGMLAHGLLMYASVEIGMVNALAGMVVLSLVVLTKLVVTVTMLALLRPDLPAVRSLTGAAGQTDAARSGQDNLLRLVAIAILPFFAYYAAWGFLGDTVREYSRLGLAKTAFGENANFLDLLQSRWLVASIVLCWALRWAAKWQRRRSGSPAWPLLIVALDATWIFIGLYALSIWKDELMQWIGSGAAWRAMPGGSQALLSIEAWAAGDFVPVELRGQGVLEQVQRLFFFILLPLVWLVMTAIVYGYNLKPGKAGAKAAGADRKWRGWLADFLAHFIGDYRTRYMPVLRSVALALRVGLPALVTLVVGYRLLGYLGVWTWMGAFSLFGERSLVDLQLVGEGVGLLVGSLVEQNGGILLDPLRICLLAATFEIAVSHVRDGGRDSPAGPAAG